MVLCEYCGIDLTRKKDERCQSSEGELMCEECYSENETTQCGKCGEYVLNEEISPEFVIVGKDDEDELGVKAGYYKTDGTFYMTDGFSVHLFQDDIEFVAELDDREQESTMDLCSACRKEISEKMEGKR